MPLTDRGSQEFSNALRFLEEDKEIKRLLLGGVKKIFKGITLGILNSDEQKLKRGIEIDEIAEKFSGEIEKKDDEFLVAMDVKKNIDEVVSQVANIVNRNADLSEGGISKVSEKIRLRSFIFWVLKLLKKSGFDTDDKINSLQDVPSKYSQVLYDILKDKSLSTLLIVLKSFGFVDVSKNQINDYEVEEEVKVLNIDKKDTIEKLERLGAEKVFEGEVHDTYYDYPDPHEKLEEKGGIKSTFRIRKKTDKEGNIKHYYTVKRRLTKEEEDEYIKKGMLQKQTGTKTKRAFEKEFEITDITLFESIIKGYGLVKSREKKKQRVSYSLEDGAIKFDFDDYVGKKSMMEIEASQYKYIDEYIVKLGLQKHETSTSGSQKFINNPKTNI